MNPADRIKHGLLIVLVLASLAGLVMAEREHKARQRAEAAEAADAQAIHANAQKIEVRDAADDTQRRQAYADAARINNSQQAALAIRRIVPAPKPKAGEVATLQPEAVAVKPADLSAEAKAKLPDAPSYVVTTERESIAEAQQLTQCQADRLSLEVCHNDKTDLEDSLEKSEDARKKLNAALNGGTFFQRLQSGAKHSACGAAGTAVGLGVAQHTSAGQAAIGGAVAWLSCELVHIHRKGK